MVEEIAHIIPTHERPRVAQRCINSIKRQWPDSHVYVCDDSKNPYHYDNATNVESPGYDIGLSDKRNLLVQESEEPYIFVWDDDYIAYEDTNLEMFYHALTEIDGVGIVSAEWLLENGLRDRWFCGDIVPEGAMLKLRPRSEAPATAQTEIGEIRYHTLPLTANWFLAAREALETCPWDSTLKLNEHLEFFCRLSAIRNETENDKKWRKRYKKLARGEPIKKSVTGKLPVYTLTTFYSPNILPDGMKEVHKGEWVEIKEEHAEELEEKGYVASVKDVGDSDPFEIPDAEGVDLGVILIPDTTCIHARYSSRGKDYEDYDSQRFRRSKFMPMQKAKLGIVERDLSQWSHYPYEEPDFKKPTEELVSLPTLE